MAPWPLHRFCLVESTTSNKVLTTSSSQIIIFGSMSAARACVVRGSSRAKLHKLIIYTTILDFKIMIGCSILHTDVRIWNEGPSVAAGPAVKGMIQSAKVNFLIWIVGDENTIFGLFRMREISSCSFARVEGVQGARAAHPATGFAGPSPERGLPRPAVSYHRRVPPAFCRAPGTDSPAPDVFLRVLLLFGGGQFGKHLFHSEAGCFRRRVQPRQQ